MLYGFAKAKTRRSGKIFEKTLDIALADNSVETELKFKKKPKGSLFIDNNAQPFGPSAIINNLQINNSRYDSKLEKAFYDTDLNSTQAILDLYKNLSEFLVRLQTTCSSARRGYNAKGHASLRVA